MTNKNRKFKGACVQATPEIFELVRSHMDFNVTGHYSRGDIFDLKIKDQPAIKTI